MSAADFEVPASSVKNGEWFHLAWGFFWRGICFTIASGVVSAIVGGMLGFVVGFIVGPGARLEEIRVPLMVAGGLIGLVLGLFLFRYYIRWMLRARFGSLRFAMLRSSEPGLPTT